jgi:hypothetical protein
MDFDSRPSERFPADPFGKNQDVRLTRYWGLRATEANFTDLGPLDPTYAAGGGH